MFYPGSSAGSTITTWYHSGRKYNDFLFLIFLPQHSLHFRPVFCIVGNRPEYETARTFRTRRVSYYGAANCNFRTTAVIATHTLLSLFQGFRVKRVVRPTPTDHHISFFLSEHPHHPLILVPPGPDPTWYIPRSHFCGAEVYLALRRRRRRPRAGLVGVLAESW